MRTLAVFACLLVCSTYAADRPNILICVADDAGFQHLSAYGCKWVKTPGFDRVAREGLLFTRAYTPNAKCAPSRSCILTGRNPWQLEEAANHWCHFPAKFKTYPEVLKENGWFVGKTGKGWGPGIAVDAQGKPRSLTGVDFDSKRTEAPTRQIAAMDYAENFSDFLNAAPKDKPWYFWYGCYEPHRGYEFGSGIAKGGKKLGDIDSVPAFWPDNEAVRTDMLDYGFEIEHFDKHLLRMLQLLEKNGQLDNTLIVVTSDNGMPFPRVKGQEYEMSNHLPLAIMWKNGIKNPGRKVDDYVSFIDLAPTFLELAGLKWEQTGMQPSPGRSLLDIFSSEKSGRVTDSRDYVLIGKERHDIGRPNDAGYPIRGIVKDGFMYLHNFEVDRWPGGNPSTGYLNCDGGPTKTEVLKTRGQEKIERFWQLNFGKRPQEEFYDISKDADCVNNLAEDTQFAARKQALKEQLFNELKAQEDPRMFGKGSVFDEYPYADKQHRNYYERFLKGDKLKAGWINPSDIDNRGD
ncbi:MAG TPA: sulfatase [Planctomycetota bacterium]|nr:sulfatase [Planctomycetota bacterium]